MSATPIYGVLAEFANAAQLVNAVRCAQQEDRNARIEAYSPFAVPELSDALGTVRSHIPFWTLLGALLSGLSTYALQWYSAVIDYPLDIGGRPTASWPAFIPAALEMTLLGAVVFGVAAMMIAAGVPRLHHPVFNSHAFERATSDRFFLILRASTADFDVHRALTFLERLKPISISEVPR